MSIARKTGWLSAAAAIATAALACSASVLAQSAGRNGWVEEPGAKVEGQPGRAYLDPASVHRSADGTLYFNESTGVMRTEDAGKVGIMLDAYDCAKNIKYMCVQYGNWRNDAKSAVDAAPTRPRCLSIGAISAATNPRRLIARNPNRNRQNARKLATDLSANLRFNLLGDGIAQKVGHRA